MLFRSTFDEIKKNNIKKLDISYNPFVSKNSNKNSKESNILNQNKYYLIDKELYRKIFIIIDTKKNNNNVDNNIYYDNEIKKDISNTQNKKIHYNSIYNNEKKELNYPINFDIINQVEYNDIIKYLKESDKNNLIEEIILKINEKYNFMFKNINYNLIYIYSFQKSKSEGRNEYIPNSIIEYTSKCKFTRDDIFNYIFNNNQNYKSFLLASTSFVNNLKCNFHPIHQKSKQFHGNNNLFPEKIEEKQKVNLVNSNADKIISFNGTNLENYLNVAIDLISEKFSLMEKINKPYKNLDNQKQYYYFISKKYMEEIRNILLLRYIEKIMENNKGKSKDELLMILKTELPENVRIHLNKLDQKIIQGRLDSKEIINDSINYFNNNESQDLFCYHGYDIISKEIENTISFIDKNITNKCIKKNCVIDENKIIIFVNNNTVKIANYKDKIILTEYIIKSDNAKLLFEETVKYGFKFIKKYLSSAKKYIAINNGSIQKIEIKIYKLTKNFGIEYIISGKLKVLILLAISQNVYEYNKKNEIYLINPEWLELYNYKKIESLIGKKTFKEISNLNDIRSIPQIIKTLNEDKLQSIDDKIDNNINVTINFNSKSEKFKIIDRYLLLFKNFLPVNIEIAKYFPEYFGISLPNNSISYLSKKEEEDFIIMDNFPIFNFENRSINENLIIFGKYNKEKKSYDIKYIFEYNNAKILNEELKYIINLEIKDYIKSRTKFDKDIEYDYISQIILNDKIIGNCYKYEENFDYNKCYNPSKYFNNERLLLIIYLYTNQVYIKNKFENSNKSSDKFEEEELYLFKKQLISKIKSLNDYQELKKIFEGKEINIPSDESDKKDIIKNIKINKLKNFDNLKINKAQIENTFEPLLNEIDIISIFNPNDSSESYMIFNDFLLFEKKCAKYILEKFEKIKYQKIKCTFFGNKRIIFHYSKEIFNNDSYICIISRIGDKNKLINEYLLKYKDESSYKSHIKKIKKDLNKFLKSCQFFNNVAPIIKDDYTEIGNIIQISEGVNTKIGISKMPELPPPSIIPSTKQNFKCKPLMGLENIGATCYMNATLQCLCIIEKLVDYFKYNEQINILYSNDINNEKLSTSFKLLIENLYSEEYKNIEKKGYYAPKDFKEKISKMNSLFEGIAANDAKDLVNFLIMTLHKELNQAKKNQLDINMGNILLDQRDKNLMFNNFSNNFISCNKSIISDLFYAINCNITECSNCKTISYNYQIYFFMIFPLEEVRKFNLMRNNNFNNNNNEVNLYDCFDYDRKTNEMNGDNAMYCNYCKITCNSSMITNLVTGPEILIIILNRGKGNEFKIKINFSLDLDLSNYMELENNGCKYELFGVITHIGESGMGGHFIAYCKEYWNNKWLKFNDAIVNFVSDFKSEVIDFAMPYLLFYKKIN